MVLSLRSWSYRQLNGELRFQFAWIDDNSLLPCHLVSLPREDTHGVVGVPWHGRVCGRGFRGMVVVVHKGVDEMIVRR